MKSQPRSPQWKGKGKEVSMDVDLSNSDDQEMSSDLSSSKGREVSMESSSEGGEVSIGLSSSEVHKPPQAAKVVQASINKTPGANLARSSQRLQPTKLRQREPTTDPVKAGKTSKPLAPGGKRKPAVASVHTQGHSTPRKIGPSLSSSQSVVIKQEGIEYKARAEDLMSWSELTLSQDVGKPVSSALLPKIRSLTIDARDTRVILLLNFPFLVQ